MPGQRANGSAGQSESSTKSGFERFAHRARLEEDRHKHGSWGRNSDSPRQIGFQNSGKGFWNAIEAFGEWRAKKRENQPARRNSESAKWASEVSSLLS